MMKFDSLIHAVRQEYKRAGQPIYIWLYIDNEPASWALSANREDHIPHPDFIYQGNDWLKLVK